ncbi:PREDICTED: naringenin 8-dimethylallyltransferase 2, chloroplastic-like isoform X2 [Lupinus angustifolius]|uniref:naringenin 8-dimethylallyltransferase 2, chloroplastic-like isoform X2 n=1 Tax=Lupinus angustifolius TaxID=3871 RepID=UPI00092FC2A4|nr:PREDICTED: naringenin 8-dimethylallyltransferase 2, chloroplastic-like isoform X2 [Lupinus angustifolius]
MASMLCASIYGGSSIKTGSYVPTLWHKTGKIQKESCVMMSSHHNLEHVYKVNNGGSACQEIQRRYDVKATSKHSFEYGPQFQDPKTISETIKNEFDIFYRFIRPYTAIPAAVLVTSVSLLAMEKLSDLSPIFFIGWFKLLGASFFMNVFHCGFNQLCDIEIDKINKPHLPLASGEWSYTKGVTVVASSLFLCFFLAWTEGSWPLFWGFLSAAILTAVYSVDLPLLRWKKSALLAATNIITNAALVGPLGYYFHLQTRVFNRPVTFPRPLIFCVSILALYFLVVSLFKDIPDTEGDKKHGVQSLSVILGQKRVFWICVSLLQMGYGATILAGAASPFLWSKLSTGIGHGILALAVWSRSKSVDLKSNDSIQSFYKFIWKLISVELFLIPLFR